VTSHADVTGNRLLAERARQAADEAMRDRRAWLILHVALNETRTIAAARKILDDVADDQLRDLAGRLLDLLAQDVDADERSLP
jgi:hypothetical protein